MIYKKLMATAAAAIALAGVTPAQASVQLAAVSGIINQLQGNSYFDPSTMTFTICQNGTCQTLFTGVAGLHSFTDMAGFNSWAGTSSYASSGGYFDNYKPTFFGVSSYFGNQMTLAPIENVSIQQDSPIPEPSTWTMIIFGFAILGLALRFRKGSPATA